MTNRIKAAGILAELIENDELLALAGAAKSDPDGRMTLELTPAEASRVLAARGEELESQLRAVGFVAPAPTIKPGALSSLRPPQSTPYPDDGLRLQN